MRLPVRIPWWHMYVGTSAPCLERSASGVWRFVGRCPRGGAGRDRPPGRMPGPLAARSGRAAGERSEPLDPVVRILAESALGGLDDQMPGVPVGVPRRVIALLDARSWLPVLRLDALERCHAKELRDCMFWR
ncbi:hypothetical protein GCM10027612_35330 [Microbispora bryophytorum subsp. camponoti]